MAMPGIQSPAPGGGLRLSTVGLTARPTARLPARKVSWVIATKLRSNVLAHARACIRFAIRGILRATLLHPPFDKAFDLHLRYAACCGLKHRPPRRSGPMGDARVLTDLPHSMNAPNWLGYLAATLTTVSFIPQAWLTLRTRDLRGVSLGMYSLFTTGVALWLLYGISLGEWPIIMANAVTLGLAALILGMKLRSLRSGCSHSASGGRRMR